MNPKPKIYGDFNNADKLGRIRLLESSHADVVRLGFTLRDGMEIEVYDNDLSADGIVRFSDSENIWVVEIDWRKIKDKNSHEKETN